jgi:hypothetical protein
VITEIDVKAVLSRSVCEFHSDLVTRPTGRAVRTGIEAHLLDHPDVTMVVLDFSQVRVLDCSCADEVIAQLLLRSANGTGHGRPATYFLLRGLDEVHAEQIDEVLARHGLALVAEERGGAKRLLGRVTELMRATWERVAARGAAAPEDLALELAWPLEEVRRALDALAGLGVVMRGERDYLPLPAA